MVFYVILFPVDYLLGKGPLDINGSNTEGETALLYAIKHEHPTIVEKLLAYQNDEETLDVNATDDDGYTGN